MESLLGWLSQYGYAGLFGLLVLGIVGLPVPDETLLVFSGYLISTGRLHPVVTFLAGFGGSVCGISVSYILGRTAGHAVVMRYGRYVHVTEARLDRVHRWFERIGDWVLTVGYFIPGVRHFSALVAGMSGLEYPKFALFAYTGAAIWVATFLTVGYFVGENWQVVAATLERYSLLILAVLVPIGAIAWWLYRRQIRK